MIEVMERGENIYRSKGGRGLFIQVVFAIKSTG